MSRTPWGAVNAETASIERVTARRQRPFTVLALSGGGANGAFGAGVLYGWSKSGQQPDFDVVSGVSAGGLMAVVVFAGSAHDEILRDNFTAFSAKDVARPRLPFGILRDGLADSSPLRNRIETVADEAFLAAVARQHRKGRRLYVTTTNLDSGAPVIWDMGAIAASQRPDSRARFIDILVASAAIPGFYNPVYIELGGAGGAGRQMHVDGSLKLPVPVTPAMLPGGARPVSLYFVVNGYLRKPAETRIVEPNLASIGARSLNEMIWSQFDVAFENLKQEVKARNARLSVIAVPETYKEAPSLVEFDETKMAELFKLGATAGRRLAATGAAGAQIAQQ